MKKFIACSFAFLLVCLTSVTLAHDSPVKKDKVSYNTEFSIVQNHVVTVISLEAMDYMSLSFGLYFSTESAKFEKQNGNALSFALAPDPVTLGKIENKLRTISKVIYKDPFVDRSYVWKYSVHFNC